MLKGLVSLNAFFERPFDLGKWVSLNAFFERPFDLGKWVSLNAFPKVGVFERLPLSKSASEPALA